MVGWLWWLGTPELAAAAAAAAAVAELETTLSVSSRICGEEERNWGKAEGENENGELGYKIAGLSFNLFFEWREREIWVKS